MQAKNQHLFPPDGFIWDPKQTLIYPMKPDEAENVKYFGGGSISQSLEGLTHQQMLERFEKHFARYQETHPLPKDVLDMRGKLKTRSPKCMMKGHPWLPGWSHDERPPLAPLAPRLMWGRRSPDTSPYATIQHMV